MAKIKVISENNPANEVTIIENLDDEDMRIECSKGMWCRKPEDWDFRTSSWAEIINLADNHVAMYDILV